MARALYVAASDVRRMPGLPASRALDTGGPRHRASAASGRRIPRSVRKPRVEVDQSLDEIEAALRRLDEGLSKAR